MALESHRAEHPLARLREDLIRAFQDALGDLAPAELTLNALPQRPPKRARVRVVAIGKAAAAMAEGAHRRWGTRIEDMLVVTAAPSERPTEPPALTHMVAAHPIPDERSVAAAEECLRRAASLGSADLLLALVSGGASSLVCAPPAGVALTEKAALVARLLEAGAPIAEVNTVRRHLSRIKGGHLAATAAPARVLTLLLSDVIDGAPHDIGSGPTVADPTTIDDARAIIHRHAPDFAPSIERRLTESLDPAKVRLRTQVLADPESLARAVARQLERRAALVARVAPGEQGAADMIARRRVEVARQLAPGHALVIPCEPTLTLPARRGSGGRAGWTALFAMRDLPPDVVLLCAASDGVDGSSGAAGAIVTREAALPRASAIDDALQRFDDAPLHRALGTALVVGPTGTNLTDVHVVARAP